MERYDALVVGGGPAGSTCAWALRRAGLDVLVLDRARFPRDKVCAGWLTPQAAAALELDVAEYERGRVLQRVTGVSACRLGGTPVVTRYDAIVSYGIRRCEFDDFLLRRSGAPVRSEPLRSLRREDGGFVANDSIHTPLVVGAGGHFCPVARSLGAASSDRPVVIAQEIEFRMRPDQERECRVEPEVPELYFCRDLDGYGWAFRKGPYLNVGFGRRDPRAFQAQLHGFWLSLAAGGRVPSDVPPRWHGHAYLLYEGAGRKVVDDGVLLCGDAAGLAFPASGEGIGPAIESGRLAAAAIVAAAGRYSRRRLVPYARALRSRFGSRRAHDALRLLPGPLRAWLGGRMLGAHRSNSTLVVDRWFLHRRQPNLGDPQAYLRSGAGLG